MPSAQTSHAAEVKYGISDEDHSQQRLLDIRFPPPFLDGPEAEQEHTGHRRSIKAKVPGESPFPPTLPPLRPADKPSFSS